ncbi:unnamed protein product, partial [Porites lobata]
ESLVHYLGLLKKSALSEETMRNCRTQLRAYFLFCRAYDLPAFPTSMPDFAVPLTSAGVDSVSAVEPAVGSISSSSCSGTEIPDAVNSVFPFSFNLPWIRSGENLLSRLQDILEFPLHGLGQPVLEITCATKEDLEL